MTTDKTVNIGEHALEVIRDTLQTELLKRGFLAPITVSLKNDDNYPKIIVKSEKFQTVPVIFKTIEIRNFGGSIKPEMKTRTKHGGTKYEEEIFNIWIPINVAYDHFNLGTNSSELFTLTGWVSNNEFDDRIYNLQIS